MKVLLNTESLVPPLTGIGNYTYHLLQELTRLPQLEAVECFNTRGFSTAQDALQACDAAQTQHSPRGASGLRRVLSALPLAYRLRETLRNGQLRLNARRYKDFIYHEPNIILKAHPGLSIATVHDLSFVHHPQLHPPARVAWLNQQLPHTLARADFLITDSECVRQELIERFNVAPEQVRSVYLGADARFRPHSAAQTASVLQAHDLQHGSYVLFVGTLEPRKGVDLLIDAWCSLPEPLRRDMPLVLAGGSGWHGEALQARIAELTASHGLRHLKFVPAADLPALYAGAGVFCYPSLYEGFGLPVLEAMSSGVPVLCSADTSMAEFSAGNTALFERGSPEHLAERLQALLTDDSQRQTLAAAGLLRAQEFSWQRCAQQTAEIYRLVGQ